MRLPNAANGAAVVKAAPVMVAVRATEVAATDPARRAREAGAVRIIRVHRLAPHADQAGAKPIVPLMPGQGLPLLLALNRPATDRNVR